MRYLALFLMLFSLSAFSMGCTKTEEVKPADDTPAAGADATGDEKPADEAKPADETKPDEPVADPPVE